MSAVSLLAQRLKSLLDQRLDSRDLVADCAGESRSEGLPFTRLGGVMSEGKYSHLEAFYFPQQVFHLFLLSFFLHLQDI